MKTFVESAPSPPPPAHPSELTDIEHKSWLAITESETIVCRSRVIVADAKEIAKDTRRVIDESREIMDRLKEKA